MKKNVLIINGPNLNFLGKREVHIYGSTTLQDVENDLKRLESELNVSIDFFQSNHEGEIVTKIQEAYKKVDFIIINAAAYTHTSVAIRDALLTVQVPFYEVHISNIFAREEFRHHSYLSDKAVGIISGFGVKGYEFALLGAVEYLKGNK